MNLPPAAAMALKPFPENLRSREVTFFLDFAVARLQNFLRAFNTKESLACP